MLAGKKREPIRASSSLTLNDGRSSHDGQNVHPPLPPGPPPSRPPPSREALQEQRISGYQCHDCGVYHLKGKHSPAGLAKINARWQARSAASAGAPSPASAVTTSSTSLSGRLGVRLCFGCGKPGHFIAECPSPHKTQLQVQNESHAVETDEIVTHGSAAIVDETQSPKRRRTETSSTLELQTLDQESALAKVQEFFQGELY